jgi:hypothetical protein
VKGRWGSRRKKGRWGSSYEKKGRWGSSYEKKGRWGSSYAKEVLAIQSVFGLPAVGIGYPPVQDLART